MKEEMTTEERVAFCGLVGRLLFEDGSYTEEEAAFHAALMESHGLEGEARASALAYARGEAEEAHRADIERLRQAGHADVLLETLREAAMADGVLQEAEAALIRDVEESLRLRLGAEQYPVALQGLEHAPLESLYALEGEVGEGSFGRVYQATRRSDGERVVIKKLKVEVLEERSSLKRAQIEDRFWREVVVLEQLASPYAVRLLGAGFDVQTPYMVLEYIEGVTLFDALVTGGPMPQPRARRLMMQVLHAIADAHGRGILHRDLKPENVMIERPGEDDERARVLDFGLAGIVRDLERGHVRITRRKVAVGTPAYMPPEQIREIHVKRPQNDVYAIGLLLLESMTARTTVTGDMGAIVRWQLSDEPVAIPEAIAGSDLGPILERALNKDWTARYADAGEMLEAIEAQALDGADGRAGILARFVKGFKKLLS